MPPSPQTHIACKRRKRHRTNPFFFRGTTLVDGSCRPLRHPEKCLSLSRWNPSGFTGMQASFEPTARRPVPMGIPACSHHRRLSDGGHVTVSPRLGVYGSILPFHFNAVKVVIVFFLYDFTGFSASDFLFWQGDFLNLRSQRPEHCRQVFVPSCDVPIRVREQRLPFRQHPRQHQRGAAP